jgi:hypothetical protein
MNDQLAEIVSAIHDSGRRVVIAITGGGSGAVSELLRVPGGSRTLLEAIVPYHIDSLVELLGREPDPACTAETASAMARRALRRAAQLCRDDVPLVGLGATASLASDRPKKGDHRCHIATATGDVFEDVSIVLEKGRRDRAAEEDLVARAIVLALARACGVSVPDTNTLLGPNDKLTVQRHRAGGLVSQLLDGAIDRLTVLPDGQLSTTAPLPRGVLPGSFNPVHAGHVELARVASEILQAPVSFEISVLNVDKPPLSADAVHRRVRRFAWRASVELTRAPTFLEKSRVFPGSTFVIGADTAERIVDAKYYGASDPNMIAALDEIAQLGCRFLVAGRIDSEGRFRILADIAIPPRFAVLFTSIPESRFRFDISSTELRDSELS